MKSKAQEYQDKREGEQYDKTYWESYTKEKFQEASNFRSDTTERQWFVNYAFYKGWHNFKYNRNQNRIIKSDDPLGFFVNLTYSTCRAVRNAVTRNQPQWDVDALPYASVSSEESRLLGQFLAFQYDKLNMKMKIKQVVLDGLLYGLGIFQYGYDKSVDYGEGNVWVETLDPFDTYIDPHATCVDNARYIIKVVSKPFSELESNDNYDQEVLRDISSTSDQSESSWKNLINNTNSNFSDLGDNYLLHETWCKTDEGIRVITTVKDKIIRNELTEFESLPFVFYFPDFNPDGVYGEGWVKNIVPLNKAINVEERAILEYIVLMVKGKYLVDNNAGVKIITDENGQIIRKNPGSTVTQMDVKPLPSTIGNHSKTLNNYLQDVGAAHEAFVGRTPTGVTAGVAFEQLVANNYINLDDLIDNLGLALSQLGEAILKMGHDYQILVKPFKTEEGDLVTIASPSSEDDAIINFPRNPEVKVRITNGIAFTKEGKREILKEMRSAGDVSRRTLLENFDIDPKEEQARIQEEMMPPEPAPAPPMGMEGMGALPPMA